MTTRRRVLQAAMGAWAAGSRLAFPGQKDFRCFDATLFEGKPPEPCACFPKMPVVYEGTIWGRDHESQETPPGDELGRRIAGIVGNGSHAVLDIERFPMEVGSELRRSSRVILEILSVARKACPATKFGFYSLVPKRDYWRAIKDPATRDYGEWMLENDQRRELAEAVDFLAPSLYTFYEDAGMWRKYAMAQISESRRMAPGRPVLPFLWPRFHESNRILENRYMPPEMWGTQVALCRDAADGMIVWGGWKEAWNDGATWWQVVRRACAS